MNEPAEKSIRQIDWRDALVKLGESASETDRQVMKLLAEGSSTPKIAKTLGTNRSAIWRRVQLLKQRLIQ
jgi:hypothetical protein